MHSEVHQLDHSAAHRSTQSELLVTHMSKRAEAVWEVGFSVPRSHWLCHPTPRTVPPTLIAETLRQAGLAVCVAGLGLDPTVHFVISALTLRTHKTALEFPRFGALEDIARVSFSDITYRKGLASRFEVDYKIGDAVSAHISAQALSQSDYNAVRRNAQRLDETIVELEERLLVDPVVTETAAEATLGVNEADPFFFDHAVDHLPGMLLLHSAVALHELATGSAAGSVSITFPTFAELRTTTWLQAAIDGSNSHITVFQGSRAVAEVMAQSVNEPVSEPARA